MSDMHLLWRASRPDAGSERLFACDAVRLSRSRGLRFYFLARGVCETPGCPGARTVCSGTAVPVAPRVCRSAARAAVHARTAPPPAASRAGALAAPAAPLPAASAPLRLNPSVPKRAQARAACSGGGAAMAPRVRRCRASGRTCAHRAAAAGARQRPRPEVSSRRV
eukprot:5606223-Prymnesium_polylepis.2